MCKNTNSIVLKMEKAFSKWGWQLKANYQHLPSLSLTPDPIGMKQDIYKIESYVASNASRFDNYRFI
jgi:hypothetical protein